MVGHQYLSNVCIKTKPSNQRKGKYVKPFTSNPKPNFGQESCPLRKLKLFLKKISWNRKSISAMTPTIRILMMYDFHPKKNIYSIISARVKLPSIEISCMIVCKFIAEVTKSVMLFFLCKCVGA